MNYESTISSKDVDAGTLVSPETEGRTKKLLIIAAAIAAVLIIAAILYRIFAGGEAATAEDADTEAPVVSVIVPGKSDVVRTINATGTLAARREIPVGVVGEGGRVTKVHVDAGDWVRQGQIMASIDRSVQNQQVARLEASVASSRANLNLAQANLDRAMQLVERGFISKADIDRLTATRDSNAAQLRVSQAQLGEARARNNFLNIVAPTSGLVLARDVEVGQTVNPSSGVLFRLAQNGELELQAQLSESDLATLSVGASADVVPVGTATSFTGQIWQIAPTIEADSRQGMARIALPYDKALRPGGFASAQIRSGSSEAIVLPESAVLSDNDGSFVYVIGKDNKAERKPVTTGVVTADGVSIVDGLSGTEQVVLFAGGFLSPGETVKPQKQDADDPLAAAGS